MSLEHSEWKQRPSQNLKASNVMRGPDGIFKYWKCSTQEFENFWKQIYVLHVGAFYWQNGYNVTCTVFMYQKLLLANLCLCFDPWWVLCKFGMPFPILNCNRAFQYQYFKIIHFQFIIAPRDTVVRCDTTQPYYWPIRAFASTRGPLKHAILSTLQSCPTEIIAGGCGKIEFWVYISKGLKKENYKLANMKFNLRDGFKNQMYCT